jgi:hypothetical protein
MLRDRCWGCYLVSHSTPAALRKDQDKASLLSLSTEVDLKSHMDGIKRFRLEWQKFPIYTHTHTDTHTHKDHKRSSMMQY